MINTASECRDLRRYLESRTKEGRRQEVFDEIVELRRNGDITDRFSLRTLFEEVVPDGREAVQEMRSRANEGVVMEAGNDVVNTSMFSNIIGQIAYADVLMAFDSPTYIGDQLFTTIPATTQQQEILPGITQIGDGATAVGENESYPKVLISEEFITLPAIVKRGFIMDITEEAIFEDKTGLLMQRFNSAAESMAITLEKLRLRTAFGVDSSYSRNGGAVQSTYGNTHTNGDFDNLLASNTLVDYLNIANSKNAFNDVVDPNTGEPIDLGRDFTIVVPDPLEFTISNILNATQVRIATQTAALQTYTANPITASGRSYKVLSNQYVSSITGDDTTYFIGNFKKAFVEREIYPTQVVTQDRTSESGFSREVVSRIKVRRKTQPAVREPRYVQKLTT